MSITSSRTVQVQFSGDTTDNIIQSALDNTLSPGINNLISLSIGDNTITAPVIAGLVITGLMIIPPAGNTTVMTLGGASGDIGIAIHVTDPVSLALDTSFVSLNINVAVAIASVRLIWT